MTVLLTACAEPDNGIPFTAQYDWDCSWQHDKDYPALTIVRTYDEFITYKTNNGLNRVEYEEDYFDGNFVIIAEYSTSNGGITYVVNKVVSADGGLVVYISREDPPPNVGGAAVMGEFFSFVGISNSYSVPNPAITLA